jgi:hypothetical protein
MLDLTDNDLIVESGTFTAIHDLVYPASPTAARITSSTAGASQFLALFDTALLHESTWRATSIGATAIVGVYTFFGDVNVDGQVTGDDYTVIDANLGTTPPAGLAVVRGDANIDGAVTGDDYTVIDANLGLGVGSPFAPASLAPNAQRRKLRDILD